MPGTYSNYDYYNRMKENRDRIRAKLKGYITSKKTYPNYAERERQKALSDAIANSGEKGAKLLRAQRDNQKLTPWLKRRWF